jgi:hypothetical protein
MKVTIIPGIGILQLPFGLARSLVREEVPGNLRTPSRKPSEDYFPDTGLFTYFDKSDQLIAVEFFEPAQVLLNGRQLLGMPLGQAKGVLAAAGGEVEDDPAGAMCMNIGVGLYVPSARDYPDDPVETVIVFKEGYYDQT